MVAIVAGNGLGLFNASSSILGSAGILGHGLLGQAGGRAIVNGANGNLILQVQDEHLSGRGLDLLHLRTYNSLGALNDGDGDGWRWDGERRVALSGTLGQAGSTVTRTDGDGHETVYTWHAPTASYVSPEGSGAHDKLQFDSGPQQWVWTDGSSRLVEKYAAATGRLISQTDASGNIISFGYDTSGRLTTVTDSGSNQKLVLTYATVPAKPDLTRLQRIDTFSLTVNANGQATGTLGAAVKQVEYGYDDLGRLTSVKTDLTPSNTADDVFYITAYTYPVNDASTRIASVTQSDGTSVSFTYESNRIKTVTDANGTQTFDYFGSRTDVSIDVGDGSPKVWSYHYDDAQRLIEIQTPAPTPDAARLSTSFQYDADGNVLQVTDARGNAVVYQYDSRGNRLLERDALGNTVVRTYDARNQLLTETRYGTPDPDGAGSQKPSDPVTTRFVYDDKSRLRFVISAEGRVTENRYGAGASLGQLTHSLRYAGGHYDVSALAPSAAPTEAQLMTWLASQDKAQVQLTEYAYDFRGNVMRRTDFATVSASGVGVLDAAATMTDYIYDGHGQLLQTIAVRGSARDQRTTLTSIAYDGLGRELQVISGSGTRTTVYDDANRRVQVTNSAGLVETRSFDTLGRLVSVSQSGSGATRTIQHAYDAAGRLRMVEDAQGGRRFSFYDATGRLQFVVDAIGAVTGFEYDANGRLIAETRYSTPAKTSGWYDSATQTVTKNSLAIGSDLTLDATHDRIKRYDYDAAGRLTTLTDAANIVTHTAYDGLSRITRQQTGDRVTRFFYDRDGRQVGVVDALGYLTEHKFDAAGRLVETVRYSTRSLAASTINVAAPVWIGVTNPTAVVNQPFEYRVPAYDADGDSLSYSVVGSLPAWLTLDTSGATPTLRGTPPAALTSYSVTLRASEFHGTGMSTDVTFSIGVVNSAPSGQNAQSAAITWAQLLPMDVVSGSTISYVVPAATAKAGQTLTYSIVSGLPPGLSFNPATRTISGTSTAIGFYTVVLRATDPQGKSSETTLSLQVRSTATTPAPSAGADALSDWRPTIDLIELRSYFYYDGSGRLVGSVDERGFLSEIVYDAQANSQQSVRYLGAVTVATGDTVAMLRARAGASQISTIEYDGFGRLSRSIGVDGTVTRSEYDNAGRLTREVRAEGTNEQRASRIRYNAFGDVTGTLSGVGEATLGANPSQAELDAAIAGYSVRYEYDSLGRRARAIDANGNATLFFYDAENRLTHAINAEGEVTETAYNRHGEVESTRRYANRMTRANLTALTGGSTSQLQDKLPPIDSAKDQLTSYEYDRRGLLIGQTDAEGVVTRRSYTAHGQLAAEIRTIVQGKTVTTQFDYDLRGSLLSQTADVSGINFNTRTAYDAFGRMIQSIDAAGKVKTVSYQDNGRTIVVTDPLNRTMRSEYDAFGRVLKQIDALDQETLYTYDDVARRITVKTPEGVQVTTRKTRHGETLSVVDGRGVTTAYEYNKDGQLTKVSKITGTLEQALGTNTYDNSGRLLETSDARGTVTRLSYDSANRVLMRRVDPDGLDLRTAYELDALGRQIKVTEGAGSSARVTAYKYDRKGQLQQVIVDPAGLQLSTLYTFDGLGNTVRVERGTVVNPSQQVTLYVFDKLGRRIEEIAAPSSEFGAGAAGTRDIKTQYRYDAAGRVSRRIDAGGQSTWYVYDAAGQLTHTVNELGEVSESRYDANGRLTFNRRYLNRIGASVIAGFGDVIGTFTAPTQNETDQRSHFAYDKDGRARFTVTANSGNTWTVSESRYDANGNVIEARRYDKVLADARIAALDTAGSPGLSVEEIAGELATLGYLEGQADTLAHIQRTRFAYDANNRLRFTVDALGSVRENTYDAAGNSLSVVSFAVRPTLAAYDETTIDAAVAGSRGNTANQVGRFVYDTAGRQIYAVRALSVTAGQVTYQVSKQAYDSQGRVVSTTAYATAVTLSNFDEATIDAAVNAVSDAKKDRTSAFAYDTAGRLVYTVQALTADKHQVVKQEYDAVGRVTKITEYVRAVGALASFDQSTIDAAVIAIASVDDRKTQFAYDAAGRQRFVLRTSDSSSWTISENRYDANGNAIETRVYDKFLPTSRVTAIDTTSSPGIAEQEMASELLGLGYNDNDASTLARVQRTRFAYDTQNRLRFTVNAVGAVSESVYDALGQRVSSVRYAVKPTLQDGQYTENAISAAVNRAHADNQIERYAFNAAGQLRFTLRALASNGQGTAIQQLATEHRYNALGQLVETRAYAAAVGQLSNYSEQTIAENVTAGAQDRRSGQVYDSSGRLVYSVQVLAAGEHQVTKQNYDALGQLVSSTSYATPVALSDFEKATIDAAVSAVADPAKDRTSGFAYDAAGRTIFRVQVLSTGKHQVGKQSYDARGQLIGSTSYATAVALADFNNATIENAVNAVADAAKDRTAAFAYDAAGRLAYDVQLLSSGKHQVVKQEYDAQGRVVSRTAYAAEVVLSDFSKATIDTAVDAIAGATDRKTQFVHDAAGKQRFVLQRIDQGNWTISESRYDANGNVRETRAYDKFLPATRVTAIDTTSSPGITEQEVASELLGLGYNDNDAGTLARVQRTRFAYDTQNRLRFTVNAVGAVSESVYNALGQRVSSVRYAAQPALQDAQYTETAISAAVDRNNVSNAVEQYAYDAAGRLRFSVQVISASVTQSGQSVPVEHRATEHRYDTLGQLTQTRTYATAVGSLSSYDTQTIASAVSASELDRHSVIVYDAGGRESYRIQAVSSQPGQPKYQVSKQELDALGQVTRSTSYATAVSLGDFEKATIDAALVSHASDRRTYLAYDAAGRSRFVVQAHSDSTWTIAEQRYDTHGNVRESRAYDKFLQNSRVAAIDTESSPGISEQEVAAELVALGYSDSDASTLADIQRTRFAYDKQNRLRFTVDALGAASERVYDALGQLTGSVRFAVEPTLQEGQYTESAISAAVDRSNPSNRVEQYAYDVAGKLRFSVQVVKRNVAAQGEQPPQGEHLVTERRYDALGRLTQTRSYESEVGHLSSYDQQTIANAVTASAHDRHSAIAYDAAGQRIYSVRALFGQDGQAKYQVTRQQLDPLGQVRSSTQYATLVTLADFDKSTIDSAVGAGTVHDRTSSFVYDALGRQRFAVADDGSFAESVYDALGQVRETRRFDFRLAPSSTARTEAELIAARGNRTVGDTFTRGEKYTYDAAGRRRTTTDAGNFVEHNEYNALGDRISYTNKGAATWTYRHNARGQVIKEIAPQIRVQLASGLTDIALETHFDHDAFGNLRQKIEAANAQHDSRTTDYEYDRLGRLKKTLLPGYYDAGSGRVERTDASGRFRRQVELSYDALGDHRRTSTRTGVSTYQYEYRTYDTLGRLKHDIDALNHVTAFTYTSFGEQGTVTRHGVTIGALPAGQTHWQAAQIELLVSGDAQARTITMEYDSLGRKSKVVQPTVASYYTHTGRTTNPGSVSAVQAAPITQYEYTAFGEVHRESVKVDADNWRDTWHYFDAMGREFRSIDAIGHHTARTYDALGNVEYVIEYANGDAPGSSGNFTPPAAPRESEIDRITRFGYNALNQKTDIYRYGLKYADAAGNLVSRSRSEATTVSSVSYDDVGRVRTQTDALGNITTFDYNALGQLRTLIEPARQVAAAGALDPTLGKVIVAPVTTMTLDAFGNIRVQERSAGAGAGGTLVTRKDYDAAGNVTSSTDARNNTTVMEVDYAGRVTRETRAIDVTLHESGNGMNHGTTQHTLDRRYAYDASGRQTHVLDVYADGATLRKSGQHSEFNAFGEVKSERRVWGEAGLALDSLQSAEVALYDYDDAGRIRSKTAGDGTTLYFYDLTGQVTRLEQRGNDSTSDGTSVRITEIGYDLLGRAKIERRPAFTAKVAGTSTTLGLIAPFFEQGYDRWGNVTARRQGGYVRNDTNAVVADQHTASFSTYNHDNQVIFESPEQEQATSAFGVTFSGIRGHELRHDLLGRTVFEIDSIRNMDLAAQPVTELRTRKKQYNEVGQLAGEVDAANRATSYAYDAHGNRIGTRNALDTVFVDKFDENGNLLRHSVLLNGELRLLSQHKYDQANRRYASADVASVGPLPWSYTRYDERNLVRATFGATSYSDHLNPTGFSSKTFFGYDALGNRTSELDLAGNLRKWSYSFEDYSVGRLTSVEAGGRTVGYQYNDFGQVSAENSRTYSYYENGLLKTQVTHSMGGTAGPTGGVDYFDLTDTAQYGYTAKGELTSEIFTRTGVRDAWGNPSNPIVPEDIGTTTRTVYTTYDKLGRVATIKAPALENTAQAVHNLQFWYDELGNIRRVQALYEQSGSAQPKLSDKWFDYDKEDRMTVADGELKALNAEFPDAFLVVQGGRTGTTIAYDALGRRSKATTYIGSVGGSLTADVGGAPSSMPIPEGEPEPFPEPQPDPDPNPNPDPTPSPLDHEFREEEYTYNELNHLQRTFVTTWRRDDLYGNVGFEFVVGAKGMAEQRETDLAGRVRVVRRFINAGAAAPVSLSTTTKNDYLSDGRLFEQIVEDQKTANRAGDTIAKYFFDPTTGVLNSYTFQMGAGTSVPIQYKDEYRYTYSMQLDGLKEDTISVRRTQNGAESSTGETRNYYDSLGRLVQESKTSIGTTTTRSSRHFSYDAQGRILSQGQRTVGPQGVSFGAQNYYHAAGRQVATLGSGTLAAEQFSFGFTPISSAYPAATPGTHVVQNGETLQSIAQAVFGDKALWYLIADANGLSFAPTSVLPSSEVGKQYRVPNVVANVHNDSSLQPYNPASIIGDSMPVPGVPKPHEQCSENMRLVATIVVIAVQVVVTAAITIVGSPFVGPVVSGAVGAAAGNLAGQVMGKTLGVREEMDFGQVFRAGVEGMVFGGIGTAVGSAVSGARLGALINAASTTASHASFNMLTSKEGFTRDGMLGALFDTGVAAGGAAGLTGLSGNEAFTRLAFSGQQLAAGALNPQSGWFLKDESRTWRNLVTSAFSATAPVFANAAGYWIKQQISSRTTAPPSGDDPMPDSVVAKWDEVDSKSFELELESFAIKQRFDSFKANLARTFGGNADGVQLNGGSSGQRLHDGPCAIDPAVTDPDAEEFRHLFESQASGTGRKLGVLFADNGATSAEASLRDAASQDLLGGADNGMVTFRNGTFAKAPSGRAVYAGDVVVNTCYEGECTNKALIDGVWHYVDGPTRYVSGHTRFSGGYEKVLAEVPENRLTSAERDYEAGWAAFHEMPRQRRARELTLATDQQAEQVSLEPVLKPVTAAPRQPARLKDMADALRSIDAVISYEDAPPPKIDSQLASYMALDGSWKKNFADYRALDQRVSDAYKRIEDSKSTYDKVSTWTHVGLSGLGAIPVVGVVADVVDLAYTAVEYPLGKSSALDVSLAGGAIAASALIGAGDAVSASAKVAARTAAAAAGGVKSAVTTLAADAAAALRRYQAAGEVAVSGDRWHARVNGGVTIRSDVALSREFNARALPDRSLAFEPPKVIVDSSPATASRQSLLHDADAMKSPSKPDVPHEVPAEPNIAVSGNAYMFDTVTTSSQMGQVIDLMHRAGFKEIHVSIGAHGSGLGKMAPDPAVFRADRAVIDAKSKQYPQMRIFDYDLRYDSEQAMFFASQNATAKMEVPGVGSLHSPCFSSACVPAGSHAAMPFPEDISTGTIWREMDDVPTRPLRPPGR